MRRASGSTDVWTPRAEANKSDVWYENGRGLLDAGWYAVDDEAGRVGPFETRREADAALEEAKP